MKQNSCHLTLGDQWVGIALSDALGMFAKPFTTITAHLLHNELEKILSTEPIKTVVVGYPKTMKGTESDHNTQSCRHQRRTEKKFPTIEWILWDERLSSKRADSVSKELQKKKKIKSHARAAAFILDSYLTFLNSKRNSFPDSVD